MLRVQASGRIYDHQVVGVPLGGRQRVEDNRRRVSALFLLHHFDS